MLLYLGLGGDGFGGVFRIVNIFIVWSSKNRMANRFFSDIAFPYNAGHMKQKGQRKRAVNGVKEEYLELRLYTVEKQAFKDAADWRGQVLSVWVRERLRIAAQRELEEAKRPVAFMS